MAPFGLAEADAAFVTWGANCGPAAIAAVVGVTLDALRPAMGDFERKGYTNPTLMWAVLDRVAAGRWYRQLAPLTWPRWGLVRVQWGGPWTRPGAPVAAAYRHTHWIGAAAPTDQHVIQVFDINAISVGGWIDAHEWASSLVPWLLREVEPEADGRWWMTHVVEIDREAAP